PDGGDPQQWPMQSWAPNLCGARSRRHRTAVRAALAGLSGKNTRQFDKRFAAREKRARETRGILGMGMLDGRAAICTGSGRGVGAEVAKLMAAYGAKDVVNDPGTSGTGEGSDATPAQDVVNQIKAAGGDAAANYGSVAKFDDCLAMVQQARDTFGELHIVFNAAGILRDKMFHNMFPEDWQAVIDVHLTGHFNINRAAITVFREQ